MKKIKYILISVIATGIFFSCDLDRFPAGSIEQSQSFQTVSDADNLVRGAYSIWRSFMYGSYQMLPDVQSDLLHATVAYGNRLGNYYNWDFTSANTSFPWANLYNFIVNLNNIINNIDNITPKDDNEKTQMANLKGEAYLMRAYAYHALVQRYAKDYEPETAETDLGVPLVLENDLTFKPSRSTVEVIYNHIVNDLTEAKKLVNATKDDAIPTRVTDDVVTALEARVYLCMHKWDEAASAANSLINKNIYPLDNTADAFKAMWVDDNSKEIIMQLFLNNVENVNQNGSYLGYSSGTKKYTPDYIPEKWVYDLFDVEDIRKTVYFMTDILNILGTDYTGIYMINKYPRTERFSTTGDYKHSPIVFRIAEMYLISAEAAAQSISTEGAALSTLNALREKRGLDALNGLSGEVLMNEIRNERTRELLCEGFRLDDLKRWKLGIKRSEAQNAAIITPSSINLEKPAEDNKFVLAIPRGDIMTNPNLKGQQNPGW